jgi:hypothetical protein
MMINLGLIVLDEFDPKPTVLILLSVIPLADAHYSYLQIAFCYELI